MNLYSALYISRVSLKRSDIWPVCNEGITHILFILLYAVNWLGFEGLNIEVGG